MLDRATAVHVHAHARRHAAPECHWLPRLRLRRSAQWGRCLIRRASRWIVSLERLPRVFSLRERDSWYRRAMLGAGYVSVIAAVLSPWRSHAGSAVRTIDNQRLQSGVPRPSARCPAGACAPPPRPATITGRSSWS